MASYDIRRIRNIGIIAHIDAGKTTVTERILYYTGKQHRMGEVHEGTATMDYLEEEQQRGITISSAATTCSWRDVTINLIDTPGHVDFTAEVERSLRVLDGAVGVFCAVAGVEAQSETVWRQADKYAIPRLAFVNKMDRTGADFFRAIASMEQRLPGSNPVPIMIPMGAEREFSGLIDLVKMDSIRYDDTTLGSRFVREPIPGDYADLAAQWRAHLEEHLAETSDELTEKFINEVAITEEELVAAIRAAAIDRKITPVFCGSALKNKGIQRLLDGVRSFLPSPKDVPCPKALDMRTRGAREVELTGELDAPFVALAFKTIVDKHGDLTFLRVYQGRTATSAQLWNSRTQKPERLGPIYRMHAASREAIKELRTGEIAAVIGLRNAATGDTLCDRSFQVSLEPPTFPETVISMRVEPRTVSDKDKIVDTLARLAKEDPTFRYRVDEEVGEITIYGMGELHLEVLTNRMLRDFGVEANLGKPSVSYRQRLNGKARVRHEFDRTIGVRDHYACITLEVEPAPGEGFLYENLVPAGKIPKEFLHVIEGSVRSAARGGVEYGFEVIDLRVRVVDAEARDETSSEMAFSVCAAQAFEAAAHKAGLCVLEPVMRLEVTTPPEHLSAIIGDLNSRRARLTELSTQESPNVIHADVPLSEVFGYATTVRSLSQGRASYSMEPKVYEPVPKEALPRIIGI